MTEARVEKTYADRVRAKEHLEQAETFLADAERTDLAAPSRAVLIHNAATCASDAILQAVGLRVSTGDRSHALRLETALEQTAGPTEDLLESLDASRERRNEASYAAEITPTQSVSDALEATSELVELARRVATP